VTGARVGVLGVGTSSFGRFPNERIEVLAGQAVRDAVMDAKVSPGDIDALFVGTVFGPPGSASRIAGMIGLGGIPILKLEAACASGTAAFHEAVEAVRSGRYERALALGVEHLSSRFTGPILPEPTDAEGRSGLLLPALYAMQAQRYLATRGGSPTDLAAVAVKNKAHGQLNPRAHLRQPPPDIETVLTSRPVAEPLTLLQCCPMTDGAAAAVIGPVRPASATVEVLASTLVSGRPWDASTADQLWGEACVGRAATRAYEESGVSPDEVDVFEVHDAFTIGEVITLEALGLCKPGEGILLAPAGHTRLGGPQPVNPSGGLLSRGHPLGATGLAQVAELVWQLRGDAGPRQVQGAKVALLETMGGGASGLDGNACVVALLGRAGRTVPGRLNGKVSGRDVDH
jgi:acetyl-CoA C-acetyltransferase